MSSTKKEGRTPIYENGLKIAIAREYLTGNLGYGKLGLKYNLPSRSIIHFVRWYRKRYPDGIEQQAGKSEAETKDSNKELRETNLKVSSLEMLIEIAGKELGIDLVKKFGTKRFKK